MKTGFVCIGLAILMCGCSPDGNKINPDVQAGLEKQYPRSSFAPFSESGVITIKRAVGPVIVETVRFKRKPSPADDPNRTEYECTLGLRGAQKDKPPTVFVSLWDKSGKLLGRFPVARYLFASIDAGEYQEVTDGILVPPGGTPAIISVEGD